MAQAAVKIQESPVRLVGTLARRLPSTRPSEEIILLGLLLAVLQLWDGVLTGIGMQHWGTHMEGNLFLRLLMEQFGCFQALVLVKSAALLVVAALVLCSKSVTWLPLALRGVIAIYLCGAIMPWSFLLLTSLI